MRYIIVEELLSMESNEIASPPISVVMSVYNGERYLREAVESILNQSFSNFEFIIVDDGSTDDSVAILSSFSDRRIRLLRQNNKGLATALNSGINLARGKYIARMDADDVSLSLRFELQYKFLERHPKCIVVGSNANIVDRNGKYIYTSSMPLDWESIRSRLPLSPFYHSSTMFQKEYFDRYGGYYEKIRHHFEDLILWNKMAQLGELWNIGEPLIDYRLVPSSISNRDKQAQLVIKTMCEKILRGEDIIEADLNDLESAASHRSARWRESNYYLRVGKGFIEHNFSRFNAAKNLLMSITWSPLNGNAWFNLIILLFPKNTIKKWKRSRGVD